ncbi:GntR family transcriptional regulator [Clostridium sp. WLY-B-L2]|jgi:DNA-binding GntR family transcriptional regulator|uniref:GntR family transcriptional regulator n=1 Tax=Clostridium aromativorans TaxID=2836848 RepID=A0ABS8N2X9_9CLOT|nr:MULTISPECIES: GntR family transcriptional regulator [Clostridium]KAA8673310.1 GntR family transcriptional regulator [Clostridium sp. HV4-5-A1G]MCC9294145.1 GntR family transcriptional regulator [Clostridium aromativorans]CAB1239998.1 Uncharacterized HTH-type transcriptional regulator YdhC [Clostridiaceae bacterium BL-3]
MDTYKIKQPVSYYNQVYKNIKEMIFDGIFKPGERIYESKLAAEFQVSRSPVREAIRSLEKDGLLCIDNKSRITVYKPTIRDIEDIYECRRALESMAARLTTVRASQDDLDKIEDVLMRTEENIRRFHDTDEKTIVLLNSKFHNLILCFSQNSRLQKQSDDLKSLIYFYRFIDVYGYKRRMDIYKYHLEIFNFIKQRDESMAAQVMDEHLANDLEHLKKVLAI